MKNAFTKSFLDNQQKNLLEHKNKILNQLRSTDDFKVSPDDLQEDGDLSQAVINQNYAISLRERDIQKLREIDEALARIDDGSYGYCEESGEPITKARLQKIPWARLSIESAEELEREQRKFKRYG